MTRRKYLATTLLVPALAIASQTHADEEATAWRLFIADHSDPRITAIDLDAPDQRWTFDIAGPARLYASAGDGLITAVQYEHERVDFLRSGIALDSHGDHADIEVTEPAAIGRVEGPRPFHVVAHGGPVIINYDRGGYAGLYDQGALLEGKIEERRLPQNVAHHGFVADVGAHFVSSIASEEPVAEDALPPRIGIGTLDADGTLVGKIHDCPNLHGEAFSGVYLLAGCSDAGVIAHDTTGGVDAFTMLPYPADFPEGTTGTLLGSSAMQVFLGNYGSKAVTVIDPTEAPYMRLVDLPFRRVDFVLDPAKPQFAYIFTEDGTLHRLNMLSAEIEQSTQITQAYSMDGHWRDPRPRLAVAGDRLVLTDPLEAQVRIVDLDTFAQVGTIPVDAVPYNIIAVGGSGLTH